MQENLDFLKELEQVKVVINGIEMVPYTAAKHLLERLIEVKFTETVNSISSALQEYTKVAKELNKNNYDL